jgi:hypothetical protein
MYVGAVGGLLVRQHETPSGKVTQSGRISEDLNAGLSLPDYDIAALRLDDRSAGRVITGDGQHYLRHGCILRHEEAPGTVAWVWR